MRLLPILLFLLTINSNLQSQSELPIWDIGTKWTYELKPTFTTYSYVTNEIVDTVTIDGMKLYEVASSPVYTGIQYFYYEDDLVYNYNPSTQILQLLYDFNNDVEYETHYRPICDPTFDESLLFDVYPIVVDSVTNLLMPDGTSRSLQHLISVDTFADNGELWLINQERKVLSHVGFMSGSTHYTHDWEIGEYICDDFGNFTGQLRCFENDSVSYNFVGYPCDTIWFNASIAESKLNAPIKIYPNPTTGVINIDHSEGSISYEVYSVTGQLLQSGQSTKNTIVLESEGINIIWIKDENKWIHKQILKLE